MGGQLIDYLLFTTYFYYTTSQLFHFNFQFSIKKAPKARQNMDDFFCRTFGTLINVWS